MKLIRILLAGAVVLMAQPHEHRVIFHDAEPLMGKVGGQYEGDPPNTVFHLSEIPKPEASLMLVSDGRVLVQGIEYGLKDTEVFIESKYAPRRTLQAWFREEK